MMSSPGFSAALYLGVSLGIDVAHLEKELEGRTEELDELRRRRVHLHVGTPGPGPERPGPGGSDSGRSDPSPAGLDVGLSRRLAAWFDRLELSVQEWTMEASAHELSSAVLSAWRKDGVTRVALRAGAPPAMISRIRNAGIPSVSVDVSLSGSDDAPSLEVTPAAVEAGATGIVLEEGSPPPERPGLPVERESLHRWLMDAGLHPQDHIRYHLPGHASRYGQALLLRRFLVGVGPAAVSFRNPVRRLNVPDEEVWSARVEDGRSPIHVSECLSIQERAVERIWVHLQSAGGLRVPEVCRQGIPIISSWEDTGLARFRRCRICLTPSGWLDVDSLATHIMARWRRA